MRLVFHGLMLPAVVAGTCMAAAPLLRAQAQADPSTRWEYRLLNKQQLLDLGKQDLAAGLTKVGGEGWELVAVDGSYIFKRPRREQNLQPSTDLQNRISFAEYDVEAQKDRVAWMERMVRKGLLSENLLKSERERLRRTELGLELIRKGQRIMLPPPIETDKKDQKPQQ